MQPIYSSVSAASHQQKLISRIAVQASGLGPVSQDLFGLLYFLIRTGEVKLHFPGPASDVDLDGRQPTSLHAQMQLFVSFVWTVALKTCHHPASARSRLKARVFGTRHSFLLFSDVLTVQQPVAGNVDGSKLNKGSV